MKPDSRFSRCSPEFWAHVRIISQELRYTYRGTGKIKTYPIEEMVSALSKLGLGTSFLMDDKKKPTPEATLLEDYFKYRAALLNDQVEPLLMDKKKARKLFGDLHKKLKPKCPLPMNKQKDAKRDHAFLTGIVNMLIEENKGDHPVDYDPRSLPAFAKAGVLIRTLARRIDGCFPSVINPIAVWEIKEYYNTTTFGSRVADGIYETLLDGLELMELQENEKIKVKHYLIVDDYYTWWVKGRSYLCRIIDMLNQRYIDEVLFGGEVVERLPLIVREWVSQLEESRG